MAAARIPLSVPSVGLHEQRAVAEAVAGGWIAPVGPELERFEAALAARTGRQRAVVVASGSAALHLQLLAAGIGPGDRVACPTLTFVATVNAITHTGAVPVLVDVDADGNLDPDLLAEAFGDQARAGTPITAVLPVDLYGKVADHVRLGALAAEHGAQLLVDAAESLGAHGAGGPAGSHGRASALSFNGNKIITASSGGAVLTDDEELADRVLFLATQARESVPHYLHREAGYNYRLSNLLAALGLAQLDRLDEFLAARRAHRERYRELCERVPGLHVLGGEEPGEDDGDNCWLTVLRLDADLRDRFPAGSEAVGTVTGDGAGVPGLRLDGTVDRLGRLLAVQGIESRRLFTPLHLQPLCADPERYPRVVRGTAQHLFETTLAVPSSPASTPAEVDEVCERLEQALTARAADPVGAR